MLLPLFDGFSIGSNDLTQLTFGVDRDFEIVAFDFDERDPGMLEMFRLAVAGATERPAYRHLRRGPCELSGDRRFPASASIPSASIPRAWYAPSPCRRQNSRRE